MDNSNNNNNKQYFIRKLRERAFQWYNNHNLRHLAIEYKTREGTNLSQLWLYYENLKLYYL